MILKYNILKFKHRNITVSKP